MVVGVASVKNTGAMTNLMHFSCACESGFPQGEHNNKQQEVKGSDNQVIAIALGVDLCVYICVCVCTHTHLCTLLSEGMLIL